MRDPIPSSPGELTPHQGGAAPPGDAARGFALTVIAGPDRGRVLPVRASGRSLLGKSPTCDIALSDPAISRRHAALEVVDGRLRITDVGSRNGTKLGGIAIADAFAWGGELLGLGATTLRVEAVAAAGEAAPAMPAVTELGRLSGASPAMRRVFALAAQLAATDVPVLIEGETGTGKELLAEALHDASARAGRPFVVFDCTTIAPTLFESALFGHERGAFTGATASQPGVFELARGGTVFFDEIGDLDLALQARLLRAIERREVQRVGSTQWIRADVRVLAATRRDLDAEIQRGRFRDDLYYRLAVTRIELPPLRERSGDVELLARQIWQQLGGTAGDFPADFRARWAGYPWPGNVRELANAIARRRAIGSEPERRVFAPPSEPAQTAPAGAGANAAAPPPDFLDALLAQRVPFAVAREFALREVERRYVARALEEHGGNITRAAAELGVARRHLYTLKRRTDPR